ncbi:MAG: alpha/beta hydrolase [Saprospiraceae bacterium]|nr:alpha/beta hydrolase [Saprospiraceae bacterium]
MKKLLFFTLLFFASCDSSNIPKEYIYNNEDIDVQNIIYAERPRSNAIDIFEAAFQANLVSNTLSTIADQASDMLGVDKLSIPEKKLKATIYSPPVGKKRVLMIYLHSGGFIKGHRDEGETLAMEFARRGVVVASIDYSLIDPLAPSLKHAAYRATQDVHMAMDYFNTHTNEYGIDPNKIILCGVSAGAILALNSGFLDKREVLSNNMDRLDELYGTLYTEKITPKAIISIAGAAEYPDILNNQIPTFLGHGKYDNMVSTECDIPFKPYGDKYNNIIDELKSYTSYIPNLSEHLDNTKINQLCGSAKIYRRMEKGQIFSEYYSYNDDHYLMYSKDGNLTLNGQDIVTKIIAFLNKI